MTPPETVFGVIALCGFAAFIATLAAVQVYTGFKR